MPKLAALKPTTLTSLRSPVAHIPQGTQERDRERAGFTWRKWYGLKRWKDLRALVLRRDIYTCQMCRRMETDLSRLVADHKHPHRGDAELFWDERNVWTLCKLCHDSIKQREERATYRG